MAPLIRALAALAAATIFTQVTATTTELPPCLDPFKPFTSAGCFADKGTKGEDALDFRSSTDQYTMTTAKCVDVCKGNKYRYAGLTFYGVCYCSQTINSPALEDTVCNLPCNGAKNETCGGPGAFTVWQDPTFPNVKNVTVESYQSLGCYTDDTNHGRTIAERQDQVSGDTMTPASCISACAADGYPFAGLEFGSECYCGVVMGNYTEKTTNDRCAMPCNGDKTKNCGGAGTIEIYASNDLLSLEPCGYVPPVNSLSSSLPPVSIPTVPVSSVLPPVSSPSIPVSSVLPPVSIPSTSVSSVRPPVSTPSVPVTSIPTTQPPVTTKPPTTVPTTTAPAICSTTIVTPATCEYGCGNWCNKNLPDFDDQDGCQKASNRCKLQFNACYKNAGSPGAAAACVEFKAWCNDVNSYCSNNCSNKKGSCNKRDCFQKKVPKGYKPGTTSVSTFPCPSKPTSTSTPVTVVPPPPTGICKQPSSWIFGYGPGKPVGGIEIPIVTCNDILEDFKAGNQFKLYIESDSRTCKGYGKGSVPKACADACQEQYTECQNVYAQGCKAYNNRRRGGAYSSAPDLAKRTFFSDTWSVALNKCKIQWLDCLAENRNVFVQQCSVFGGDY
ncbi:WSC domain-containing protein [Colletotrichum plurivorum]|uniref:WSC domain-containing protein n=1 Tax=Colletotrichum plurivorum TaxID=2175906 RepID=A0A8H6NC93_9PEZI|nr:WSC domain-containing protein [Colletotrichum plurivorum]